MKGYPITRDELFELGGAGSLATICFSVGGGLLGRSYDIQQDLEMNQITAPELQARWQAKESDYFYFGIFLLAIGAIAFLAGGAKIWSIIKSTEHPND